MERKKVTIGLVQMSMTADASRNVEHALEMIDEAAERERAWSACRSYSLTLFAQYEKLEEKGDALLQSIPGEVTETLSSAAKDYAIVLIGGSIYEREGKGLYNTSVIFDRKGEILGKYRKTHIPHDESYFEQNYFRPGDTGFQVFDTSLGRMGVLICYDQWFPEAARVCALLGADIVFYPTAIGTVKGVRQAEGDWQQAWEGVMRGHAIANGMVVAAANRCGTEDKMDFWGGSVVFDAFGKTLARGGKREQVILATVDLDHGRRVKEGWRFFHNRRPECYSKLVERW